MRPIFISTDPCHLCITLSHIFQQAPFTTKFVRHFFSRGSKIRISVCAYFSGKFCVQKGLAWICMPIGPLQFTLCGPITQPVSVFHDQPIIRSFQCHLRINGRVLLLNDVKRKFVPFVLKLIGGEYFCEILCVLVRCSQKGIRSKTRPLRNSHELA